MPRDSNGAYNLPPSYLAVTGQDIVVTQHNPVFEDVAAALTGSLPRNGSAPMLADLAMGGFKATSMGAGIAPTDAATKGQVDASAPPIGSVIDFAGPTAPAGWVLCYGQEIGRSSYASLFAVIGTTYGVGDGATTFNVPDCRGRVAAGKDNMGGSSANRLTGKSGGVNGDVLGSSGGVETHTLTTVEIPTHTHTGTTALGGTAISNITVAASSDDAGDIGGFLETGDSGHYGNATVAATANGGGPHMHTFTTDSTGSGGEHNNVQPAIIFNKIIRSGV